MIEIIRTKIFEYERLLEEAHNQTQEIVYKAKVKVLCDVLNEYAKARICDKCGHQMTQVRPGKYQCDNC